MSAFLLTQRFVVGALSSKRGCLSLTQSFVRRQASSSSTLAVSVEPATAAQHHDAHSSSSTMSRMAPWLAAGAVLTAGAALNLEQGNRRTQAEPLLPVNNKILSSDDYTNLHRTLQEVNEQPEAIARALNFGECMGYEKVVVNDLDQNEDKVNKISHLTLSAQGTSLNAARYGERLMKELGAFTSVASVDSANMQTSDFPCFDVDSTGLIVVSDCESAKKDVSDAVASAMEKGVTVMNVVNTLGSLLASTDNKVGAVFGTDDSDSEYTMTSTKVFTTQVAVLALISLWFKESRDRELGNGPSSEALELKEALMRLPIMFGMTLQKREQCREIAKRLQDKDRCFVIGKGFAEPVAQEGASIISEISSMNADSCQGKTEIGGDTPVFVFILNDQHAQRMRVAAQEAKDQGADLIVITDDSALAEGLDERPIVLPANGRLTALAGVLPLQLIAYELAILRGIN